MIETESISKQAQHKSSVTVPPKHAQQGTTHVVIAGLDIPFPSLVWLLSKIILATIPAILIAIAIVMFFASVIGKLLQ